MYESIYICKRFLFRVFEDACRRDRSLKRPIKKQKRPTKKQKRPTKDARRQDWSTVSSPGRRRRRWCCAPPRIHSCTGKRDSLRSKRDLVYIAAYPPSQCSHWKTNSEKSLQSDFTAQMYLDIDFPECLPIVRNVHSAYSYWHTCVKRDIL